MIGRFNTSMYDLNQLMIKTLLSMNFLITFLLCKKWKPGVNIFFLYNHPLNEIILILTTSFKLI